MKRIKTTMRWCFENSPKYHNNIIIFCRRKGEGES